MKFKLNRNGVRIPYLAEKMIQRKVHKLKNMLHEYASKTALLRAEILRLENKKAYEMKLKLKLSDATFSAGAHAQTITVACGNAFEKLFQSIEELKSVMRGQSGGILNKENRRNVPSGERKTMRQSAKLARLIEQDYQRFYNYALREIRFRCYQGFTKPGAITVRDILDDALVRVADRLLENYDEKRARRLIFNEIRKGIDRQLNPGGTGMISIENTLEPEDIDTDYQEYYQPDEIVKVEDIVIDENAEIPEDKVEYEEIETYIDKILSQLPADWREAFMLIEREGLVAEEIAKSKGTNAETVLHDFNMAKNFLRDKLADAGFDWKGSKALRKNKKEDSHG
ncbi:MAG: hypothetical protein JXB48_19320 [Candidatus Latescibacteria bacterium]|nr:hypothetical protein [Candidatus Latescibacterota bacterium]